MFFIFSKDKMLSYVISFSTVIILLMIAFHIKQMADSVSVSADSNSSQEQLQENK